MPFTVNQWSGSVQQTGQLFQSHQPHIVAQNLFASTKAINEFVEGGPVPAHTSSEPDGMHRQTAELADGYAEIRGDQLVVE
jgi:hypothetical protein